MFLLARYFAHRYIKTTKERNVCILGLNDSGKTSFLNDIRKKFNQPYVEEIVPTIGQNLSKIQYRNIIFTIWDVGGQLKFRDVWENYYAEIDCLVWLLDSSNSSRFEESVEQLKKVLLDPKLIYVPVCIIANKQDLKDAITEEKVKELFDLDDWTDRKWKIVISSFGKKESHYGTDAALNWVSEILEKDPLSKQRTQWRKSYRDSLP